LKKTSKRFVQITVLSASVSSVTNRTLLIVSCTPVLRADVEKWTCKKQPEIKRRLFFHGRLLDFAGRLSPLPTSSRTPVLH